MAEFAQFRIGIKLNGDELILVDPQTLDKDCPWMLYALQERGQAAVKGAKKSNKRVVGYLQSLTLAKLSNPETDWESDETNWCAGFVNWCLEQAGYAGTGMAFARSYLAWPAGKTLHVPRFGCIAVFERGGGDLSGHVGFFLRYNADRSQVFLLGGNQSRQVKVSEYSAKKLLGFRWPKKFAS